MAQHFRATPASRNFNLFHAQRLTDQQICRWFQLARWGSIGMQVCPHCGAYDSHYVRPKRRRTSRRPSSRPSVSALSWRCKHCFDAFSVTTKTIFHQTKLSLRQILMAITLALGCANGLASLELANHLGIVPKTSFLLLHRLREVMCDNLPDGLFDGLVQIDGGYFCGKPRKPRRKMIVSKEQLERRYGKRKVSGGAKPWEEMGMTYRNYIKRKNKRVILVITQSGAGRGMGALRVRVVVCRGETDELVRAFMKIAVKPGAMVFTDESGAYTALDAQYQRFPVCHAREFSTADGVNDNHCEAFFSRLRRAEYGVYHGMRHIHLYSYACEAAWRHNHRTTPKLDLVKMLLGQCLKSGPSKWFRGYYEGKGRRTEVLFMPTCDMKY